MSKEPNRNVYVGHRYVPKIMGEWDKSNDYEGLSIVTHQGASYTSKKRVPVGIDILNDEFWVITGNYNAQVDYYRDETEKVSLKLDSKSDKTYVDTELGKKSDKTYVDTELGKKSDKTYVDTELGKKSDKTYVDTELGKKTDKTYVDTEIGKKTDKTYVDTEIGNVNTNLNDRMVNVKQPEGALTPATGDGTDETNTIQNILNTLEKGDTLYIPYDVIFNPKQLVLKNDVDIMYKNGGHAGEDIYIMNKYHPVGIPINEFELNSPYHTALILNSTSEMTSNVPNTETTLARSIVYRLNNKTQAINTVYPDSQFLFRHVPDFDNKPFGSSVYGVDAKRSEFILGQPMRMSTRKGTVSTTDINSRPLFSYSNYFGTEIFIDNVNGNDETGDGTLNNPYRSFEKASYEALPHIAVGNVNIYLLNDYMNDFTISGIINMGYKVNIRSYGNVNGLPNKYHLHGIGLLDHLYGEIHFDNFNIMKHINVKNCYNTRFSEHEFKGTDYGLTVENSNIIVSGNNYNNVNYGVRADDSKVQFENNTGICSINTAFARDGAVINISGTQPDGDTRQVLTGMITPGANGNFWDTNGKRIIVSNGLITEIREPQS